MGWNIIYGWLKTVLFLENLCQKKDMFESAELIVVLSGISFIPGGMLGQH